MRIRKNTCRFTAAAAWARCTIWAVCAALGLFLLSCEWAPVSPKPALPQAVPKRPSFPTTTFPPTPAQPAIKTGAEGVWYEIFTCSFYDSDGDKIGDIPGIISKLDYLNDSHSAQHAQNIAQHGACNASLHIDGIWLTPIMPAPSLHKYDTTDYFNVDPDFGTLADVQNLRDACHERGIKLIVDLAVNHSSSGHPWFTAAKNEWISGNRTTYADYYNFQINPNSPGDGWNWTAHTSGGENLWYYGSFGEWMPDFNWDSPKVLAAFETIIEFWLDPDSGMGLDGFRLDATKHIYENGRFNGDTGRNIAFWTWFAKVCRRYNPNAYMVGECLDSEDTILKYHEPGMSSFALNFANNGGRIGSAANDKNGKFFAEGVLWWTNEVQNRSPFATASPFLSNHDFDRSSTFLIDDAHRKMAAALLLLFPGTPFMYYGEEIGLVGQKTDDDPNDGRNDYRDVYVRGPMYWTQANTTGRADKLMETEWKLGYGRIDPASGDGAAEQLGDSNSLLRYYIDLINLKKKYPWIAWGKIDSNGLDVDNKGQVGAYRVTNHDPADPDYGKSVVIVHNSDDSQGYTEPPYPPWPEKMFGYVKIPRAQRIGGGMCARFSTTDVARYDMGLEAWWIRPYSTVIFEEFE
jgi:glycosidase